jgi:hypothetical protein
LSAIITPKEGLYWPFRFEAQPDNIPDGRASGLVLVGNSEVIAPTFFGATPEWTHGINTGIRHSNRVPVWYIGAMIRHNESAGLTMDPCAPRPSARSYVPPSLERAIAARWRQWIPWVRMQLLRARQSDPTVSAAIDSPESCRMRERHTEFILAMTSDGVLHAHYTKAPA